MTLALSDVKVSQKWIRYWLLFSLLPSLSAWRPLVVILTLLQVWMLLLDAKSENNNSVLIHDLMLDELDELAWLTDIWLAEEGGVSLLQMCPPAFEVQHYPIASVDDNVRRVARVYQNNNALVRWPDRPSPHFECFRLVLGDQDRAGILLVHHHHHQPTG